MNSKTPKFDGVLEKYFSELELDDKGGQERTCRFSGEKFYVRPDDIRFYKKINVPLPTLCPNERMRLKETVINISKLFYGQSAKTDKTIISGYPGNTECKIWEKKFWVEADFGSINLEIDEIVKGTGFFAKYRKLQLMVPRPNLFVDKSINSNYTNFASNLKNCYLCFDAVESEECLYCEYLDHSKNCYYSNGTINSDTCYNSLRCDGVYSCHYTERSGNCLNSYFLSNCKDCNDCFMCTNLRHKKYYFENEQLSKEEYFAKLGKINFGSAQRVKELHQQFEQLKKNSIGLANGNVKNINSIGGSLKNTKDCYLTFASEKSENVCYSLGVMGSKDIYDACVTWPGAQLSYEIVYSLGLIYNTKFSILPTDTKNCEYCDLCRNCSDCFGCISLKNKQFCIFNKQYTEDEYWKRLDEIKTEMLASGEYGEFFPPSLALFPYTVSEAIAYDGYRDIENAAKYGYNVEVVEELSPKDGDNEIDIDDVPDDIKNITEDILQKVIVDKNGKKFKYSKREVDFCKKHGLALMREHFSSILAKKRFDVGPLRLALNYRDCAKCGERTLVTFPESHPNAPTVVYCRKCYNKEIV